jgi:hypothetical protein
VLPARQAARLDDARSSGPASAQARAAERRSTAAGMKASSSPSICRRSAAVSR